MGGTRKRGLNCYYCDRIVAADPDYIPHPAAFDLGSEAPRCAWHWRYVCDHCGKTDHFMSRFFCPGSEQMLCPDAGQTTHFDVVFWSWTYTSALLCPKCGQWHLALDHAEQVGAHPWQRHVASALSQKWLSREPFLVRYPPPRNAQVDPGAVTDAGIEARWSANADIWSAGYDERGDDTRRNCSDPVLLAFLGEVRGHRVLDAGSGNGYLSRLLAKQGGRVVAVEQARRFYEIAVEENRRATADIEQHLGSVCSMPFLQNSSFDAVVANYVLIDLPDYEAAIGEAARVLKPGGRFVYTVMHGTIDRRWHKPVLDSPRREDRAGFLDDDYFIRRAGYLQWGKLKPLTNFHRPLRDYVAACARAGLELRDLDEPGLSDEARGLSHLSVVREEQRMPLSYVLKFVRVAH